jgi:hypothetical protein
LSQWWFDVRKEAELGKNLLEMLRDFENFLG